LATSIPIGLFASGTITVRVKEDQTVPEQSDFLPSPATQRTPPTICLTRLLLPPLAV
jgi:hypothetical protein